MTTTPHSKAQKSAPVHTGHPAYPIRAASSMLAWSFRHATRLGASRGQFPSKQRQTSTWIRGCGLITVCFLVTSLGCQPPAETNTDKDDSTLHFAVVPKGTTHIFWQSVKHGAEKAGQEIDVKITFRGPSKEDDRDEQISVVQSFLNAKVDGILLAPLDADALVRPVKEASRAGVPVVVFDSGLNTDSGDYVSYVATDNLEGGKLAAQTMAKSLGEEGGKVIVLRYEKGSESTHQREEGFLAELQKFPKIEVLSSDQYAGSTTESAIDKAQALLNRFGDEVDAIYTVCEPTAEGVLRALRERNLAGKVKLVTFDSSDSLRNALSAGEVDAIVLQDPVAMGYQAVKTMAAHLRGETPEAFIDTGVFVATAENQDEEPYARLLSPAIASD